MTSYFKCDVCRLPMKIRYDYRTPHICEQRKQLKEAILKVWVDLLDELAKLPEDRQLFYLINAVKDSIIVDKLEDIFSDDDLAQLTKFEKKIKIFKIDLEEWM